jgi:hypothetical protein
MLAVLLLPAVVLGLCPLPVVAKASPLAALNVQVGDLPAGSQLVGDQHLTSVAAVAKADDVPVAAYVQAGMIRANKRLFAGGSTKTPTLILAAVYLLRAPTAAHAFYARQGQKVPRTAKRTALWSIGDEGADYSGTDTGGAKSTLVNAALFRRGAYVVEVAIEPVTKRVPGSLVPHLAALVDSRIQHAH